MIICKYLNAATKHQVRFEQIDNHIVRLVGDIPAVTSGFTLSRIGNDDNWDYSDYTTIYRQGEGYVEYSNDGSVYVEPEPIPRPEPIPSGQSYDERITALESAVTAIEEGIASV